MPKIAIIGAGGYVFPLTLVRDILSFDALQESELSLYDPDPDRVAITADGARRLVEVHGLGAKVEVPVERREALDGADFVICTFQVGGIEAYGYDVDIPREFGVDQPVGDTLGPGGVFRGLRSVGALKGVAADMAQLCPSALLIQYANPMSVNCWATSELGVKTVGLCHSVQHTSKMLARELDVPYEEVTFDSAGVNHTAWFTTFRRGEEDLIPRIREVMTERHLRASNTGVLAADELYAGGSERVRSELMALTGYFHTESSHHASEYWAWFRKSPDLVKRYISKRWDYYEICSAHSPDHNVDEFVEKSRAEGLAPSEEYGAYIIDSAVTGTRRVIYGNVPNTGLISNLGGDCCVEVACVVDALGLRPIVYGSLPPACAALNTAQVNVQRLAVRAALESDRSLVYAAVALDPLTGAMLTLPQIRQMVDRLIEAERPWLGDLAPAA
ncbi:MAG TPA: alpha-galactosidase [Acidimicrobiales bacterium]|nr:alpha-galactosidase [Acidimicrobiales bacterium]